MEGQMNKVRRLRSSELRKAESNYVYKKRFILFGTVTRVSKYGTVLISRGDTGTNYWVSYEKDLCPLEIGEKCKFEITISTFIGHDNIVKTKLRIKSATPVTDENQLLNGFGEGHMAVNIVDVIASDIPNLYVLVTKRMESGRENETYHLRYYSEDKVEPEKGNVIVKVDLKQTKNQINSIGEIYTDLEQREYLNGEGKMVKVESAVYRPCLAVTQLIN